MGVDFAAERKLLTEGELEPVLRSHYPTLEDLPPPDALDLARWLRDQHGRARDIIRDRRRARRGKADARSTMSGEASERGLAAKKQVFARALKRVNARLGQLAAAERRAQALVALRDALARRQAAPRHHPASDRHGGRGMRPKHHRKARPIVHGARIGSTSQAVRTAQAARDSRGS